MGESLDCQARLVEPPLPILDSRRFSKNSLKNSLAQKTTSLLDVFPYGVQQIPQAVLWRKAAGSLGFVHEHDGG
jgi:hypothetical protein